MLYQLVQVLLMLNKIIWKDQMMLDWAPVNHFYTKLSNEASLIDNYSRDVVSNLQFQDPMQILSAEKEFRNKRLERIKNYGPPPTESNVV